MTTEIKKGQITLYAAGGCGINIAKQLEKFRGHKEFGLADISIVYIDTSRSNGKGLPEEHTYLFEGMDGSGKVRAENYQEISKHARGILQKFAPGNLSIVLSSASGGSGSVIAPTLLSELLGNEVPVIAISVGSTDSALEIQNTLNTLKSYEGVAQKRELPVVMSYFQNSKETSRAVVNAAVTEVITTLMAVFSGMNEELDSQDLKNFLNFPKVTKFKEPRLVGLSRLLNDQTKNIEEAVTGNVIGMVSLLKPGTQLDVDFTPDYQAIGYLPEGVSENLVSLSPITFVTLANTPQVVAKDINARLLALEKAQKARVDAGSILGRGDEQQSDGLVL